MRRAHRLAATTALAVITFACLLASYQAPADSFARWALATVSVLLVACMFVTGARGGIATVRELTAEAEQRSRRDDDRPDAGSPQA